MFSLPRFVAWIISNNCDISFIDGIGFLIPAFFGVSARKEKRSSRYTDIQFVMNNFKETYLSSYIFLLEVKSSLMM